MTKDFATEVLKESQKGPLLPITRPLQIPLLAKLCTKKVFFFKFEIRTYKLFHKSVVRDLYWSLKTLKRLPLACGLFNGVGGLEEMALLYFSNNVKFVFNSY